MKTLIARRLLASIFLLSLLAQPLLAEITGYRIKIGNPRKQYCPFGLGICRFDGPVGPCWDEVDVSVVVVSDTEIVLAFHDLPIRHFESTFATLDTPVPHPERFGYKSMTILEGDYPFNWTTEQVTVKFRGERLGTTFFNDLGPGGNVYQCCAGLRVSGSQTEGEVSYTAANQFQAASSGSVSQIDIGIGHVSGANSFYASIWTDSNGLPGTELARWDNLSSGTSFGQCCGLVTISGITGLTLTAGESYFLVLGPEIANDTTWEMWNLNSTGVMGTDLYSNDGGTTWNNNGRQALGAFDILSN